QPEDGEPNVTSKSAPEGWVVHLARCVVFTALGDIDFAITQLVRLPHTENRNKDEAEPADPGSVQGLAKVVAEERSAERAIIDHKQQEYIRDNCYHSEGIKSALIDDHVVLLIPHIERTSFDDRFPDLTPASL